MADRTKINIVSQNPEEDQEGGSEVTQMSLCNEGLGTGKATKPERRVTQNDPGSWWGSGSCTVLMKGTSLASKTCCQRGSTSTSRFGPFCSVVNIIYYELIVTLASRTLSSGQRWCVQAGLDRQMLLNCCYRMEPPGSGWLIHGAGTLKIWPWKVKPQRLLSFSSVLHIYNQCLLLW